MIIKLFSAPLKPSTKPDKMMIEVSMIIIKVPTDIQKSFFGCGVDLTMFHIKELSAIISSLIIDTKEVCSFIKQHFD